MPTTVQIHLLHLTIPPIVDTKRLPWRPALDRHIALGISQFSDLFTFEVTRGFADSPTVPPFLGTHAPQPSLSEAKSNRFLWNKEPCACFGFRSSLRGSLIILTFTNAESEGLRGLVIYSKPQSWEVKLGFKFSQTDFQEASFALFMLWVNQFFSNGEETFVLFFKVFYRNRPRCGLLSSEISNH